MMRSTEGVEGNISYTGVGVGCGGFASAISNRKAVWLGVEDNISSGFWVF